MASEYQQTTQQDIQDRVRKKYKTSIDKLKILNFREMCFFSESMPALGLSNGLFGMLGVIAALPIEVLKIGSNLSASLFFVLMTSSEYDTYVSPFGLGVKFYTSFSDGTCLITANFESPDINDDREKLYKFARPGPIEAAWKHHQTWVEKLTASGKQRKYHLSFDDFTKLARKEDSYMLRPKPLTTAILSGLDSTIIAAIIFGCLLAAVSLIYLFLPQIVHILYPACWFVRNLNQPSLLQGSLIVFACLIISWFLARMQKNIYTIDGIGTRLHGRTPLPDSRGYISTKWLVFAFLPLLPVQSYQIDGEYSNTRDKKFYSMQPLNQLHWKQIKETIWQFKFWYAFALLLWIGVGLWSRSQCI